MNNLKIKDLINVIKRENGKIARNATKIALAGIMTMTQVGAVKAATTYNNLPNHKAKITHEVPVPSSLSVNAQKQEVLEKQLMTLPDFIYGSYAVANELMKYISYPDLLKDVNAAYYLVNYAYITPELEQELVANGIIAAEDIVDSASNYVLTEEDQLNNVNRFFNLRDKINEYNTKVIRDDYYEYYNEGKDLNRRDITRLFILMEC